MIARHIPMRCVDKSDFGSLVEYLLNPQDKQERVGKVTVTHCLQDHVLDAALEIQTTQALNTRTEDDKTYHLILSFQKGEQLSEDVLKAIESRVCTSLGYKDHQRISVVHHDTDNLHVHLAINKIHPTRYTIHTPYYPYKILGRLCEHLEQEYGLGVDNHKACKTRSENRADDMEHHSGVESLLNWIKRECSSQMKAAQSWSEIHKILHDHGLEIRERTTGLVITNGKIHVKASSVARSLSKGRLEKKLGTFKAGSYSGDSASPDQMNKRNAPLVERVGSKPPPQCRDRFRTLSQVQTLALKRGHSYDRQPLFQKKIDTTELYAHYKSEQQTLVRSRAVTIAQARQQKDSQIKKARQTAKLKRLGIQLLKGPSVQKKFLYHLVSRSLHKKIADITSACRAERQKAYHTYPQQTWADWLQSKAMTGDQTALAALRARESSSSHLDNILKGPDIHRPQPVPGLRFDTITKAGTLIYRVGATAIRDDGEVLNISRGAAPSGLEAALRLAVYRYGPCLEIKGSEAFKEQILHVASKLMLSLTFEDPDLEHRRQERVAEKGLKTDNINKEYNHDRRTAVGRERGRRDRSRYGFVATDTPHQSGRESRDGCSRLWGHTKPDQSHPGSVGRPPPPLCQNRLRNLSELSVVQLARGSQVLLPSDVSGHVEYPGSQCDHGMRRQVYRPASITPFSPTKERSHKKAKRRQ